MDDGRNTDEASLGCKRTKSKRNEIIRTLSLLLKFLQTATWDISSCDKEE
jgi:hypothetical protein